MIIRISGGGSGESIYEIQRFALEQVSRNDSLRAEILSAVPDKVETNGTLRDMIPMHLDYDFRVCDVEEVCGIENYPDKKEVYADEILISSTLTEYSPKKLKLFVWLK